MTNVMMVKLRMVKQLLRNVLSLTPVAKSPASTITNANDRKSGYGARKLMSIGKTSLKVFCIVLFERASIYRLRALATLAVPRKKERN